MGFQYFQVTVESLELQTNKKKDGGTYQTQVGYAHVLDRDGKPRRYPVEIKLFPPKDAQGAIKPYPPGEYFVSPKCFHVDAGFLKAGFIELEPLKMPGNKG